jgi:hypothetical protein
MARTGASWTPVDPRLADPWPGLWVQATPGPHVPGRPTDQAAARWGAQRRRGGLWHARVSPPPGPRAWRERTRDRTPLGHARVREGPRVPGVLARATSTLASGRAAMLGGAGRAMWEALSAGRAEPAPRAALAQRRRRSQREGLAPALPGSVHDPQRPWRARPRAPIAWLEAQIEALTRAMVPSRKARSTAEPPPQDPPALPAVGSVPSVTVSPPLPCPPAGERCDPSPGLAPRGAEGRVAASGRDRSRVETAPRLAAWAGVAPGHDDRAGTPRSGTTRQGNRPRRAIRTPRAPAAVPTKGPERSAWSRRLAARRGQTRALSAVAPARMVRVCHRLSRQAPSHERGAHSGDERRRPCLVDRLIRRMAPLGSRGHLEPVAMPAV